MTLTPEELKEAMFKTRLEVFELMYQLKLTDDWQEKKTINNKIKVLQRLHYWQIRQLNQFKQRDDQP